MHAIGGEKRQRVLVCEVDLNRGKISKPLPETRGGGEGGCWRGASPSRQCHVRCWEQPRRLPRGCSGWTSEPQRNRTRRSLADRSGQSLRASSPAACSSHYLLGNPHGPQDWGQRRPDRQLLPPILRGRRALADGNASVRQRKAAETSAWIRVPE
jgi:hypothetical protein